MRKLVACAAIVIASSIVSLTVAESDAAMGDCGQPSTTGSGPVATDALFTLRVAVGAASCPLCVCDVNDSGTVSASDSLHILRVTVGQPLSLDCPPCMSQACESLEAPQCGGTCLEGLTCAPSPLAPDRCNCLGPCQLSAAPTCGGSCELPGQPDLACQAVTITAQGASPLQYCECLPVGLQACADASAPVCGGVCPPGSVCEDDGDGACACTRLPLQGPCEQADAPACAGTCAGETICQPAAGGGCTCAPYAGQEESCPSEPPPGCTGACAFGSLCAAASEAACECFSRCELADAPTCGGACQEEAQSCVATTISVGGTSVEFCTCR